jgi:cobalt-precorrin 5A hydrolase
LEGTSFSDILEDAANLHDLEFRPLTLAALRQRNGDCVTRSDLTLDLLGIASVAEASALAAAGPGSELLTPRRTIGHITIATARSADTKENDR